MTPEQATDLAERTLAAITEEAALWAGLISPVGVWAREYHAADRERVASDLAGLRLHYLARGGHGCYCGSEWLCDDHARYADGLRRTAALYGVRVGT